MSSVQEASYLVDNAQNIAAGLGSPVQIQFAMSQGGKGGAKGGGMPMPQATGMQTAPGWSAVPQGGSRLYMKGLPLGLTDDQLTSIIGAYGSVVSLKVLPPPPNGATDSAAIVQMGTDAEAKWIVENLDGNIP